jgi:hypothetical protein
LVKRSEDKIINDLVVSAREEKNKWKADAQRLIIESARLQMQLNGK